MCSISSVQSLSRVRLCDPMNRSTPGFPVHHQHPELAQTHAHQVSDAIQPSHPLLSPPPLPSIIPSIRVFSNESVLHIRWSKYWSFSFSISPSNEYSGLISFRIDWFDLLAVGILNVPLISLIFLKTSLVFPIILFSSTFLHWSLRKAFFSLLAILWSSAFRWVYASLSLPFSSFLRYF